MTTVIMEAIVQQTKLFASQRKVRAWQLCTEELQAFIGLNVAMGMLHLPQVRDYWSTGGHPMVPLNHEQGLLFQDPPLFTFA